MAIGRTGNDIVDIPDITISFEDDKNNDIGWDFGGSHAIDKVNNRIDWDVTTGTSDRSFNQSMFDSSYIKSSLWTLVWKITIGTITQGSNVNESIFQTGISGGVVNSSGSPDRVGWGILQTDDTQKFILFSIGTTTPNNQSVSTTDTVTSTITPAVGTYYMKLQPSKPGFTAANDLGELKLVIASDEDFSTVLDT